MDLTAIGQQFGLNEAQTRAALEALTPVVAAGVRRSAQTPDGLQDMFKTIMTGGHEAALNDASAVSLDRAKPAGDDVLGQIFGSKDVSRGVAQQLSATSGIGAAILKQLLPIVASLVIGKLAKGFGGGSSQASPSGGGLGGILKDIFGGGAAPAPAPAPQPRSAPSGQGGSLEDILNDILKGGQGGPGGGVVKHIPQDQMGDILKDIFGGRVPGGLQRQPPSDAAVTRGRKTLDDALGGGTRGGTDADILLDGVDKAVRRGG